MFFGFDLKEIFMFPIKDQEARKHFLIGCLVAFAAFIIPILPYLILFGYAVRISKQVLNNESPRMIAWDDLGGLAKDGLKMFGVRMIFTLPILIIALPLMLILIAAPILMGTSSNSDIESFLPIFMLLFFGGFCLIIPFSIPLTVIIPGAEMYVVEKDEFSAAFRFREWWPIFRANLSGFIAAFGIYFATIMALTFVTQLLYATLIFACLLIVLMPASVLYPTLIMYATTAQAFRDGKIKLAEKETAVQPA